MDTIPTAFWATYATVMGGCLGSFLAVIIERTPDRRSLLTRSACTCGTPIPLWRNIPLLAWPALRGRAACCGTPIPAWYWHVELACATVAAVAALLPIPAAGRIATATAGLAVITAVTVRLRRRTSPRPGSGTAR